LVNAEERTGWGFFSVPLSVRQAGMAGVTLGRTDPMSQWTNPALSVRQESVWEAGISGDSLFGLSTGGSLAAGWKALPDWAFGSAVSYFGSEVTEYDAHAHDTFRSIRQRSVVGGLSAAWRWEMIGLGAALKAGSESIDGATETALAADIGAVADYEAFSAGLALRNMGTGQGKTDSVDVNLPLELRAGIAYTLKEYGVTGVVEYVGIKDADGVANIGVEWWPMKVLGLRGGVADLGTAGGRQLTLGFSAFHRTTGLDYAYALHTLGSTNRVALTYAFGG